MPGYFGPARLSETAQGRGRRWHRHAGSRDGGLYAGADFIITGSVNQCSVEAATSDEVKDLLQHINIQDTDYAPAGDMFEQGAKVQVLRRGVFFRSRQ